MKKIMFLISIILLLASCSSKNSSEIKVLDLTFDDINEIRIHTLTNGMTIESNEEWKEFVDTMSNLEYQNISKTKVEDIFESTENYFVIILVLEEGYQKFFVYDNNVITYYVENINDNLNEIELLIVSHDDVAALFSELSEIDFPAGSILMKKPVIYIYPEETIELSLFIESECEITTSYPKYENGWNVIVEPTGTITDKEGKKYSYLYWEGKINFEDKFENGFIVKREETITFLEEKLEVLGLNYQERNDFITYWLPDLEKNKYNKIRFLSEEYEKLVKLDITPEPETLIRVFMVYKGLEEFEKIEEQVIKPIKRHGYTIVDWGGAEHK